MTDSDLIQVKSEAPSHGEQLGLQNLKETKDCESVSKVAE